MGTIALTGDRVCQLKTASVSKVNTWNNRVQMSDSGELTMRN